MSRMSVLFIAAVAILGFLQPAQAQKSLQLTMDANSVWIRAGEAPVLEYAYASYGGHQFKPYLKELYSPAGVNVLLDAPPDHLHHHGLMFAVGADGVNFWEETPTAGRQIHRDIGNIEIRAHIERPFVLFSSVRFAERVYWKNPSAPSPGFILSELREIRVCQRTTPGIDTPATVLAWTSKLTVSPEKPRVVLGGSHYFGLGMRFPRSMDGTGQFLNADGKEGTIFRGEERLVQSNWCAYQVTAEGKPVTIAMFGNRGSRQRPTTWFTMAKPFAYMSATLGLHEEPLEIRSPLPLILMYAVVIWDRHVLPVQIDAYYREWAHLDWPIDNRPSEDAKQSEESK